MNEFRYFMFHPIEPDVLAEALPDADEHRLELAYKNFLDWFGRNSRFFYYDQLHQHNDFLRRAFCAANAISETELFDSWELQQELQEYKATTNYPTHLEAHERWKSLHTVSSSAISFVSNKQMLSYFEALLETGRNGFAADLELVIPAWFNSNIRNDAEKQKALRAMPYQDYLKSNHWMRVRALTALTFGARCIGKGCRSYNESLWFEYASSRHVHHISYKNRGNERFGDVCLLCDNCHRALHKDKEDILDDGSVSRFLNSQWIKIWHPSSNE